MQASPAASRGRRGRSAIVALAVAVVASAILLVGAAHAGERCEPSVAQIVSVQGRVEVQAAGSAEWMVAALDERLCVGDGVRTGGFARAALALANDFVLSLDQLTTMRLGGEAETGRSLLDLLFGDVHFFSHRPRALEIVTPIANAGTEGTEFLMRARPDRTEVVMFAGRVRLTDQAGELLLASGDAAVASAGQAPRPEIVARPRDAVAWALYYPPILAAVAERRALPRALPQGLQQALERVAANDYAGAIEALDAVPAAARDARYETYRAGVLLNVGRADEAAEAIERALALEPQAADALAERAVIEVVQNRREAALADAGRAVELNPESAPAAIALSYALQASFDLEAARATLREAAARTPEDALVQARLAEIELSFGDLDAAEAAAARAVALAPELARTQMVLGFAALTRIDIDQAKAAFEHAIALDSAEPLARLGLGLAKIRAGDLEDGRRELEIAAALDPNSSLLRSYLGKAYFEEKREPEDADQFQIAKELDPNDPTPYFYDAIRLQTENRPVEALRNLETSIRLNDNRAVYRSRLLLDEDTAVRETSLARIYDDLGFGQVALVEATKSLNQDPANYSAHRFLSDTYATMPRHEIARASELLQSQLLQPININPVQPSLPLTDLNVVTGAGPAQAAFDEFTPLFARNETQLTTTGVVGNHDTYGGEGVVTMLHDRTSLSVGGSTFATDGFRDNADDKNKLADVYGQVAVTPKLNLQAEYRYRDTDQGDIQLNFDPDDFIADKRRDVDQQTARLGAHFAPSPGSDVIASFIYTDRHEKLTQSLDLGPIPPLQGDLDARDEDNGYQVEGRYLVRGDRLGFNATTGFGVYAIDNDASRSFDFNPFPCPLFSGCENKFSDNAQQQTGYVYGNLSFPTDFTWTLGLSYDHFEQGGVDLNKFNPKIGGQWSITDNVRLRMAAFRTVKRALVVNQTIEPTQIAGFNQFYDDFNGSEAWQYAVGLDSRLSDQLYAGAEASHRDLTVPSTTPDSSDVNNEDWHENLMRLYAYWTLAEDWALTLEYRYDQFESDSDDPDLPRHVNTHSVPLAIRYFNPWGIFAEFGPTFVYQDVDRGPGTDLHDGNDQYFLLDAAIGYRLPKRRGIISLEATNLLDQNFSYQDDNFRSAEDRSAHFSPQRSILARVTLNF